MLDEDNILLLKKTELEISGLDPEKLEKMSVSDRNKLLVEAGLDPQKYDF